VEALERSTCGGSEKIEGHRCARRSCMRQVHMSFSQHGSLVKRHEKEPHDEDINTSATIIPSVEIIGPITRSRAQQLNHQVNSFLCSSTYNIESQLLPNDLIVLRNEGKDHGGQTEHQEGVGEPRRRAREGGEPIQFRIAEFESNSESRTTSYSN
jgi:hypothetical protein